MSKDEQEIRELVATWMTATKAGDTVKVLSLMTEDAVFLIPGQAPMSKTAFAAASAPKPGQQAPGLDFESEIKEIQVNGDWAFMWSKLRVVITPLGTAQSITRAGHTLSILKKDDGKWQLARDANMLAPVKD